MVEWLSQRVMHRPFVNEGAGISNGLTFREQDERDEILAKKKKVKYSKIEDAMESLKKAILSEMDDLVEKHKKALRKLL